MRESISTAPQGQLNELCCKGNDFNLRKKGDTARGSCEVGEEDLYSGGIISSLCREAEDSLGNMRPRLHKRRQGDFGID